MIAAALEQEPAKGFPRALGSDAELEAFYRFINNEGFSAADIVAPHLAATFGRAEEVGAAIAIHDTSYIEYSSEREGLGYTTCKGRHGFVAHVSLMAAEANGLPLGVAHLEMLTRSGTKWRKRKKERLRSRVHGEDESRESLRWLRGVESIERARAARRFDVVHVTDAEGDFFELFASMNDAGARFVIRAGQQDREVLVDGEAQRLRDAAADLAPMIYREIELSERKRPTRGVGRTTLARHPNRSARRARVAIGATRVTLKKTRYSGLKAASFDVNVVRVWEIAPVPDEPAVEWLLLTTESVATRRDVERVVDIYRRRWMIEEYFKALKSGCSLEKRQVESYDALCKVLALFVPIAYRLLFLRNLERLDPLAPATEAFSEIDLRIMRRAPSNRALKPPETVADALLHVARLGGHLRNNGRPGWQTLSWGYEKLLALRLGWELAEAERCDQS